MQEIEELISEGGDKNIFTQQVKKNFFWDFCWKKCFLFWEIEGNKNIFTQQVGYFLAPPPENKKKKIKEKIIFYAAGLSLTLMHLTLDFFFKSSDVGKAVKTLKNTFCTEFVLFEIFQQKFFWVFFFRCWGAVNTCRTKRFIYLSIYLSILIGEALVCRGLFLVLQ